MRSPDRSTEIIRDIPRYVELSPVPNSVDRGPSKYCGERRRATRASVFARLWICGLNDFGLYDLKGKARPTCSARVCRLSASSICWDMRALRPRIFKSRRDCRTS